MSKTQPQQAVVVQPIAISEGRKIPFEVWAVTPPVTQQAGFSPPFPGLELLSFMDTFTIDQIVDPFEVVVNVATRKNYIIANAQNQICYRVAEETSVSMITCCGAAREFTMHIKDFVGNEVLTVHRPFKHCLGCTCSTCCTGCAQLIEVNSRGVQLGSVVEIPFCTRNQFEIRDAGGYPVAIVMGPTCLPCNCTESCCRDVDFRILTPDMASQIGDITRKYLGCWTHYLTTADSFTINFDRNVDPKLRALIVGAVFLIDFRWFEVRQRDNNQGGLVGLTITAAAAAAAASSTS